MFLLAGSGPLAAETTTAPVEELVIGNTDTQGIATNLDGSPVPADIGQIYIGNTTQSADAITIDSGANFPPGVAFRRYLGDSTAPTVVMPGTQLGYLDFRGYSGNQFWNAASLDVVVDGAIPFSDGSLPPTKMRFAVSDGSRVYSAMELTADGRLEIGANNGSTYTGPGLLGSPNLYVNADDNKWGAIFSASSTSGASYAMRVHTGGETVDDYLIGASSGVGTGSFKFSVRGNGDTYVGGKLYVGTTDIGAKIISMDADIATIYSMLGTSAGSGAIAFGVGSQATSPNSTVIGNNATSTGANAIAIGSGARGNGVSAISVGDATVASGAGAIAVGSSSVATTQSAVAVGFKANALRTNSLALGSGALAEGESATVIGYNAVATAANATAIGTNSRALHAGSTAVGAGAVTTAANQVALGGAGTAVKVGDIAASTAAQVGPVDVVTVDKNGTLGRQQVVTTAQLEMATATMMQAVSSGHIGAVAVSDVQFSELQGRVEGIEGQVSKLFDLAALQSKETKRGIAAVTALAQPHFPSEAGKTSYASNIGYYRGEVGVSAGAMHRFEGDFGVLAGISYSGGKNTAARVGVAGEF
ncbi:hypothetical protein ASD76_03855 [Altererythrobacter sp. Root672]|nr:hypothetical protein ASD76_03855 [Altererythrobacter sp. Root672]